MRPDNLSPNLSPQVDLGDRFRGQVSAVPELSRRLYRRAGIRAGQRASFLSPGQSLSHCPGVPSDHLSPSPRLYVVQGGRGQVGRDS